MATLILTAVGTIFGGPLGGAIGAMAGRALDQAVFFKPKGRSGPRLAELQVQTSVYGTQIPAIFGTMRVAGTVIWATDLRETKHRHKGGKGQPSYTTYTYSASFAVAVSARAIASVGRIWADGNLLRGSGGDFKSDVGAFRLHQGSADQPVDPLIAAAEGVALTPGHRGMAYAVFEDLQLADFGNRIPSLTFEVVADAGDVDAVSIAAALTGGRVQGSGGVAVGGYAASGDDVRAALGPLVAVQGMTLREAETGLRLEYLEAGADVILRSRLAARLNGRAVSAIKRLRDPAEAVPVRMALRHYDPDRDYQAGVQSAVRPGAGRREAAADLPALMEAGQARALARACLDAGWAGRRRLELLCGWDALALLPGSVVAVEGEAGAWRIVESEWEAMGVRLTLTQLAGGHGGMLPASSGSPARQPDVPHGATTLVLADLPVLSDAIPSAPIVVAAAAGASAGWRRAALFLVEPGSGEALPAGSTAPPAVMGTLVDAVGAGTPFLFDDAATLSVEVLNSEMTLLSASDEALLRGGNLCLVGQELIQFGSAVQTGARTFRLGRLLRGRRGTEWAMAGHDAGAPFLLIEQDRLAVLPDGAAQMGDMLSVLGIGIGDTTPATAAIGVTGEALLPLSPVGLTVAEDALGNRLVRWTRRSRGGWRWLDGVDAPLGEEREAYAVRLMDGGAVVRAVETGVAAWSYPAADAAADIAAGHGGPLTVEVRQIGTHAIGRVATIAI